METVHVDFSFNNFEEIVRRQTYKIKMRKKND